MGQIQQQVMRPRDKPVPLARLNAEGLQLIAQRSPEKTWRVVDSCGAWRFTSSLDASTYDFDFRQKRAEGKKEAYFPQDLAARRVAQTPACWSLRSPEGI